MSDKIHFDLGCVVATPVALKALEASGQAAGYFLDRHANGDWGEVGKDERRMTMDGEKRRPCCCQTNTETRCNPRDESCSMEHRDALPVSIIDRFLKFNP